MANPEDGKKKEHDRTVIKRTQTQTHLRPLGHHFRLVFTPIM